MPGNRVRLCSLPKFELVSCKEDFYFIVDTFEDRCYLTSTTLRRRVNITMAMLVVATIATTTSRTATLPTATRRTHIASTTAKE